MRHFKYHLSFILVLCSFVSLFSPLSSFGRGGGGHSYSGSHSSSSGASRSSSSGGGGGGSHSYAYPGGGGVYIYHSGSSTSNGAQDSGPLPIGFLLVLILIFILVIYFLTRNKNGDSDEDQRFELSEEEREANQASVELGIQTLSQEDQAFSLPLLKDFCYALYSTLHHARGKGTSELNHYRAYLSDEAFLNLQSMNHGSAPVLGVVIGTFEILNLEVLRDESRLALNFEANYTESLEAGKQKSYYSRETWSLARKRGVKSRPPERSRAIVCPSCGSPAQSDQHGKCPACGQIIRSGIYDWYVEKIAVLQLSDRPPLLTSTVEEEGTDLPTVYDRHLETRESQLLADLNTPDLGVLNERVQKIFFELQKSWTLRNLNSLRPYETDSLFETQLYWIEEYKKQHLINRLENVLIQRVELCKIVYDAYYISVTVRIFAQMKDWTESENGKMVCGSRASARRFSEYWTLIRSRKLTPPKGGFNQCPACGAELQLSQAGVCTFCNSKITSGDFDWVLSSIEQDEAYRG